MKKNKLNNDVEYNFPPIIPVYASTSGSTTIIGNLTTTTSSTTTTTTTTLATNPYHYQDFDNFVGFYNSSDWFHYIPSYSSTIGTIEKFYCYESSKGHITEEKREIIFNLFDNKCLNRSYKDIIKYTSIGERLMNTLMMEYALIFKPHLYMSLMSKTNGSFTSKMLFDEVIKGY